MEATGHSTHAARLGLASQVLQEFGKLSLAVYGNSMVPTIFPGEVVTVRRTAPSEVECGDIILYTRGDRFFAHRAVRRIETFGTIEWVTRGDSLYDDDPPVFERELLGAVTSIQRGGKQLSLRRTRTLSKRVAAWCVRRFSAALAICLRWHKFRNRLASCDLRQETAMQGQEGNV